MAQQRLSGILPAPANPGTALFPWGPVGSSPAYLEAPEPENGIGPQQEAPVGTTGAPAASGELRRQE